LTADDYIRFLDRTSTTAGERHPALALLQLGPRQRCLDLGCGLGEDARAMAETSGARVVGIDRSPRMVNEARSRSVGSPGATFLVADAAQLPFPDSTFDAAWVKRTLMHIARPERAIGEMAAGATRTLVALQADRYANPRAGRQLRRLMLEAGLADVRVEPQPVAIADLATAETTLRLLSLARSAAADGTLTPDEAATWEEDLRARERRGLFVCYALVFVAGARVPDP
jgi:SAM-dependent methyltransferase